MKKSLVSFGFCVATAVLTSTSSAAVLAGWEMNGLSAYGPSPFDPTTTGGIGYTVVGLTRGSGVTTTGTAATSAWGGNGWNGPSNAADAVSAGNFLTFSLTVSSGYTMSLDSIGGYNIRRSTAGPATGQWQYSMDGDDFADLTTAITWGITTTATGNAQNSIDLSAIPALQNMAQNTTVTFRVVNWDSSGSSGTWYFNNFQLGDDLMINGATQLNISAVPEPSSALAGLLIVCGLLIRQRRAI